MENEIVKQFIISKGDLEKYFNNRKIITKNELQNYYQSDKIVINTKTEYQD